MNLTQLISIIKNYVWDNIEAPFIITFHVSLIICAGLLITGDSVLVDDVATVAYFFVVFGVILHCVSYFLQHRDSL